MPRRKSFAARVKAASKRAAAHPAANRPAQAPNAPATARLRDRELASHPGSAAPPATAESASSKRRTPASRDAGSIADGERGPASPPGRRGPSPTASEAGSHGSRIRRRPQRDPDPGYVAVGRVLAPFGLKGELKVLPLTDNPDRFRPKARLYAGEQLVTVLRSREAGGHIYLTLKGFPTRDAAEKFRHALLQVPEADLPPLPAGQYYRFQLLGLKVVDRAGALLGTLDEVIETGSNDVYRIHPPAGPDVLLPALADVVVSVDLESGVMVVDPPEWL